MRIPRWAAATMLLLVAGGAAAEPGDRLSQFAALGRLVAEGAPGAPERLWAVVDAEILESLAAGGPFASTGFLAERLDGFGAAWGGAALRVLRPAREPDALTFGLFTLLGAEPATSLRIYGRGADGAALLAAPTHPGALEVQPWPGPAVLALWALPSPRRATHRLHLELWRGRGGAAARAWSSAEAFPEGLWASRWSVGAGELALRRELRYQGWKPGCDGQTEEEVVLRASAAGLPEVAARQLVNGWHRELGAAVARFFAALAAADRRALAELVPDAGLRGRLPARLTAEPACDEARPGPPRAVEVAATEESATRRVPWSLTWSRGPGGWRLVRAAPVLQ